VQTMHQIVFLDYRALVRYQFNPRGQADSQQLNITDLRRLLESAQITHAELCQEHSRFPTRAQGALSGYDSLVVSMLASGTQDRGFEPGRKILSMPSFGGEVKQSVPCRMLNNPAVYRGSRNLQAKFLGHFSPASVIH
jgi:hypothetical protein